MARAKIIQDQAAALGSEVVEIKADGRCILDILDDIAPGWSSFDTTVTLNGNKLYWPTIIEGVVATRGDEELFIKPILAGDSIGVIREAKAASLIYAAIAVVAALAVSLLVQPKIPGNVGEVKQSSNNTLYGQENTARLYQAIPDNYGFNELFPDLMQSEAFSFFDKNQANIIQHMQIGVGSYDYDETKVRLGSTLLSQIPGATVQFYQPFESILNYKFSDTVEQIEGQTLRGTEGESYTLGDSFTFFTYDSINDIGYVEEKLPGADPQFNALFPVGTVVTLDNSSTTIGSLDGDYVVVSVESRVMGFSPAASVNSNWLLVVTEVSNNTNNISVYAFVGDERPVGPFDTSTVGDGVQLDFTFTQGLKDTVKVRIDWQQIDEPGGVLTPGGATGTEDVSYSANSATAQNYTYEIIHSSRIFFRVTVTRIDAASTDPSKPNLMKWARMASFIDFGTLEDTIGTTRIRVEIPGTANALSPRENKVNLDATRIVLPLDGGVALPSLKFGDCLYHMYTQVFMRPASELDIDGLLAIQDSIDSNLSEFAFSFDDLDVGLGERIETMCNCVRVAAFLDGNLWRFTRDEKKQFESGQIGRRNIASTDRDYSWSYNPRLPADSDSVKLEYVNPITNKKGYIFRKYDASGNIVNEIGANPYEVKLAGCRNTIQAVNRAELEIRKILYQRESISDTLLNFGQIYDIGDLVRYADVYREDLQSGEIRSISGLTAKLSESFTPEDGESYTIQYNDDLNNLHGPYGVIFTGDKEVTLASGNFSSAFLRNGTAGRLGSTYIISKIGNTEPELFTVSSKEGAANGNVQLQLLQYDERTYEYDEI